MDATNTPERFERASHFERQLNARQKRVLDLIADGRTNGEIASALGMTLDGAKWNVSEILTKLGLSGREEAGAYWRWRKRRTRWVPGMRLLRGAAALPVLKLAGGVVAALLVVGGASVLAVAGGAFAGNERGAPDVVQAPTTATAQTGIADATATPVSALPQPTFPVSGIVPEAHAIELEALTVSIGERPGYERTEGSAHSWLAGPGRARCERVAVQGNPAIEIRESSIVVVADGATSSLWQERVEFFDGRAPVVDQSYNSSGSEPLRTCVGGHSVIGIENASGSTLAERLADIVNRPGEPPGRYSLTMQGPADVLGREVTVIAYENMSGSPRITGRIWYDERLGIVLREEYETAFGASNTYEVTRLVLDGPMPGALFVHIEPPPDIAD